MTDDNAPPDLGDNGPTDPDAARGIVAIPLHIVEKWQAIVDTMAELIGIPAGLIMRVSDDRIEVVVSSRTGGNPYIAGESDGLIGSGLYCAEVIQSGASLLVPDALVSPIWKSNPDVERKMISYLGYPIRWPDRQPFGTICVLDNKPNAYNALFERLVRQFRDIIEHHLKVICSDADRQIRIGLEREQNIGALRISEDRFLMLKSEMARASCLFVMGEFAASVIHQISQPLTAIVTNAETSLRWLARPDPDLPQARDAITQLVQDGRRATGVIASLRSLAKSNHFDPERIDINHALQEVLALVRKDLDRFCIERRLKLPSIVLYVPGNRIQLQQVLLNLLRNAIESLTTVMYRPRLLDVTLKERPPGKLLITIGDSGAGIPIANMAKVFDPLFTTKGDALGMGLAICQSIVGAHNGRLLASSPSAGGAVFELTLPQG